MTKRDISNKSDIEKLVTTFYSKATVDIIIGQFFTDVIPLDLKTHLPKITDFWSSLLLKTQTYTGNPMLKHIELSQKREITEQHFERWLMLWKETVDHLYFGVKANEAKERASQIGGLMLYKIRKSEMPGKRIL